MYCLGQCLWLSRQRIEGRQFEVFMAQVKFDMILFALVVKPLQMVYVVSRVTTARSKVSTEAGL